MTALVTKHLPVVAGAPDGIKRLRALILELAVRGRLLPTVPQTNSDVPAEWIQTKLGSILAFEYGDNLPAAKRSNTGEYPVYGSNGVVGTHSVCFVQQPCIVIGRKGSAGALNLCTSPGCCVTDVAYYCVPPQSMSLEYTFKLLHTLGLDNLGKGIKPGLNRNEAYALEVLVPPLAEQHRIVAKVDELMALCDRLEADQADAEAAHAQLVQALLGSLTQATDAADFRASWQRLSEHFHTLFTTEASIDELKQAVLQLGVTGKLVLFEANADPVTAKLPCLTATEEPLDLPPHWRWVRLGEVCKLVTSGSRGWKEYYADSGSVFIRSQDIKADRLEFDNKAYVQLPPSIEGARTLVDRDDLLITITGANVGKAAHINEEINDAYVSQHVALVRLKEARFSTFIHRWLTCSHGGRALLLASSYGAKPGLNMQNIRDLPIPIPPLVEQRRIVAKVDELMALCDQLKAQLQLSRQQHAQLASSLVEQAVA